MKLTFILLTAAVLQVAARSEAQSVSLDLKNVYLDKVFNEIRKQTGFMFLYDNLQVRKAGKVSVRVKNATVETVLEQALNSTGFDFKIIDNTIVLTQKSPNAEGGNDALPPPPIDVKGRVVNEAGEPIEGASVMVKGTKIGTTTNANGEFQLSGIDDNAVLVISAVSIETQEISVVKNPGLKSLDGLTVLAKTEITTLNEVVINKGYYTEKQRFTVGNVGKVTAKDIGKQPVNNPLLALQGRVTGLFITQSTGLPGTGVTVRIQGQNSIGFGNDPLYVIDGVPYISQLLPTIQGSILGSSGGIVVNGVASGRGNPLNFINSADIESIEVLKDADATSIYGSRAANGAILITTKKGKAGKTKVDFNFQKGWGKVTRKIDLLSTEQYLAMRKEAYANDGRTVPDASTAPSNSNYDLTVWNQSRYTDWQKVLIGGTAQFSDAQMSISGGTPSTSFLLGAGYHRETTVFPGDLDDKKGSMHFAISNISVNQKFKVQLTGNYLVDYNEIINRDLTEDAVKLAPNAPMLYNEDGSLNWESLPNGNSTWQNPLSYLQNKYKLSTNNLLGSGIISYELLKDLDVRSSFGYTYLQSDETILLPLLGVLPENRPSTQRFSVFGNANVNSWIVEPQISYNKGLKKARLEILIGSTFTQNNSSRIELGSSGYNSDYVMEDIRSASSVNIRNSVKSVSKYNALFGRINYTLLNRYIINLTARRDGSSRFGSNSQFHNFGSIAGAWIFSDEAIFQEKLPFVSFGKLRASYGTTGNDQIGDYQFMYRYNPTSVQAPYQNAVGLAPIGLPNPYLEWEETRKLQLGLDFGLLNDKVLIGSSYFQNRSSNQLLTYNLAITAGFGSVLSNFPATVKNSGWELYLNVAKVRLNNLIWTSSLNFTIPKNKLVEFPNIATSSYANTLVVGQPITLQKAYHFLGVNPAIGAYQFADKNGNPVSQPKYPDDYTVLINTSPTFYGGFQNNISYKNFEIDFLFQFVKKKGVNYYGDRPGRFSGISNLGNQPDLVVNRWQKPGDNRAIQPFSTAYPDYLFFPYINFSSIASDASWSDASFFRLKNLSFSYRLPEKWYKKTGIQNVRIFSQGQNLMTITKYKGLDPETESSLTLPPLRVITVGAQVTF